MMIRSFAAISLLSDKLSACQKRGINYGVDTVKEIKSFIAHTSDNKKEKSPVNYLLISEILKYLLKRSIYTHINLISSKVLFVILK